jgi:hypothetical protein
MKVTHSFLSVAYSNVQTRHAQNVIFKYTQNLGGCPTLNTEKSVTSSYHE